jgi:hypothetical protein
MQKIEMTFNTLKDDGTTPDGKTVLVTFGDVNAVNPAAPVHAAYKFSATRSDFILSKEDATIMWVLMDDVTTAT